MLKLTTREDPYYKRRPQLQEKSPTTREDPNTKTSPNDLAA
jgi:hypothetical protein